MSIRAETELAVSEILFFHYRVDETTIFSGRTYPTVQPEENLLIRILGSGREEPKVQLPITVAPNWQLPGIRFTNIEVDVRNGGAVHDEF